MFGLRSLGPEPTDLQRTKSNMQWVEKVVVRLSSQKVFKFEKALVRQVVQDCRDLPNPYSKLTLGDDQSSYEQTVIFMIHDRHFRSSYDVTVIL